MSLPTFAQPFTFANGLTLKNRVVLAPMTNGQSPHDGDLSPEELRWLTLRAEGDYGSLITAASHVQPDAQAWHGQVACFTDHHREALRPLAEVGKAHDALTIMQLFHGGLRSPRAVTGVQPQAPSEVHLDFPGFEMPKALTDGDIEAIIKNFVHAAQQSVAAGLGGVEIHGANGYLFTQFISKQLNLRQDRWGGSLENRSRLLLEVTRRVRQVLPKTAILGVRLLAEDSPAQAGFDIDDVVTIVGWLGALGIDYVHLSQWDANATSWKYPGSKVSNTAVIRSALPSHVALITCGGVMTPDQAEAALSEGADLVAVGRAGILEPAWPREALRPGFKPRSFPLSVDQLHELGVSDAFVQYLRAFKMVT